MIFAPGGIMATDDLHAKPVDSHSASDKINTELSSRRTRMSFQRTRMSADRTMMSIIRTALSLIGFGFTLFQVFGKLHESGVLKSSRAPRNFGETLVFLGIGLLILGISYHVSYMVGLRRQRKDLESTGLIQVEHEFPVSLPLVTAIVLLGVGVTAIVAMMTGEGPLS
jgi:putative membrane protein